MCLNFPHLYLFSTLLYNISFPSPSKLSPHAINIAKAPITTLNPSTTDKSLADLASLVVVAGVEADPVAAVEVIDAFVLAFVLDAIIPPLVVLIIDPEVAMLILAVVDADIIMDDDIDIDSDMDIDADVLAAAPAAKVVNTPPVMDEGAEARDTLCAADMYASSVLPLDGGLTTPTIPFWQWRAREQ